MTFFLKITFIGSLLCWADVLSIRTETIVADNGVNLDLPCSLSRTSSENDTIFWKQNEDTILYVDFYKFSTKEQINLHTNFTLSISNFSVELTGNYTCELNPDKADVISYLLRVSPKVESVEGETLLELHDDLVLECKTSGGPEPNINWIRQKFPDSAKEYFHTATKIYLENVNYGTAGFYTCEASIENITDSKTVQVVVRQGLTAQANLVYAEPQGKDTKLCCKIDQMKSVISNYSETEEDMIWIRDQKRITFDNHVAEEVTEDIRCLVFHQVEKDDLGNYTCLTKYSRQKPNIKLSGAPKPPILVKVFTSNNTLMWEVFNGRFPVTRYSVLTRLTKSESELWNPILTDVPIDTEGKNEFTITCTFTELENKRYDVTLIVDNGIETTRVEEHSVFRGTLSVYLPSGTGDRMVSILSFFP